MNEITRIHLAKTAFDIEIAAKKQLEKYIKSLESYTQDADVLADIEIRMTELLAERGVTAGGVIASEDVAALRKQLGEPYEFADNDGDVALGPDVREEIGGAGKRRLYRSMDNALLGGVLSGAGAYFNVNPLWLRLGFIVLTFMSFGTALLVYVLFWALTPPARTAAEKLHLAGKRVTVESIKELNDEEDRLSERRTVPILQQVLFIGMGLASAFGAVLALAAAIWSVVAALTLDKDFLNAMNGFTGLGEDYTWLVWVLFWIAIGGMLLLGALFSLVAFAFFKKKLTKKMMISGLVIIVLGIASAATVIGVSASQSIRVANESRSLVRETTTQLPKAFASVEAVNFVTKKVDTARGGAYFPNYTVMRYVVDDGPARYELSALPSARAVVTIEGKVATISLDIPESFRNTFVQPIITVYGPALQTLTATTPEVRYEGQNQKSLKVMSSEDVNLQITGSFNDMEVSGQGNVDLSESTIRQLSVVSERQLTLTAGTVRNLTVVQPEVCSAYVGQSETSITVAGVIAKTMRYNGTEMLAETHKTNCAEVVIGTDDMLQY